MSSGGSHLGPPVVPFSPVFWGRVPLRKLTTENIGCSYSVLSTGGLPWQRVESQDDMVDWCKVHGQARYGGSQIGAWCRLGTKFWYKVQCRLGLLSKLQAFEGVSSKSLPRSPPSSAFGQPWAMMTSCASGRVSPAASWLSRFGGGVGALFWGWV